MKINELRRFQSFYRYANYFRAADMLRDYLDLPADYPIPLGLPHGIDFGQFVRPLDVGGAEPIFWAFNQHLLEGARTIKPALPIPHPIWLTIVRAPPPPGSGSLVIGPPPSPTNDQRLLALLKHRQDEKLTVLVKAVGNYRASMAFWESEGLKAVTLRDLGEPSYPTLASIFYDYGHVIGSTISSALFFAGAMGRSVELIRGYRYVAYEAAEIASVASFHSPRAVDAVKVLARGNHAETTALSQDLLGATFETDPTRLRTMLKQAIADLPSPVHFDAPYPHPVRPLLRELAVRTGRHRILSKTPAELIHERRNREVVIQELDEVGLWLDGPSDNNPSWTPTTFVRGLREPGNPVDEYH